MRTSNRHSHGDRQQNYDRNVGFATSDHRYTRFRHHCTADGNCRMHFFGSKRAVSGAKYPPGSSLPGRYSVEIQCFTTSTSGVKPTTGERCGFTCLPKIGSTSTCQALSWRVATHQLKTEATRLGIRAAKQATLQMRYLCPVVKELCCQYVPHRKVSSALLCLK